MKVLLIFGYAFLLLLSFHPLDMMRDLTSGEARYAVHDSQIGTLLDLPGAFEEMVLRLITN